MRWGLALVFVVALACRTRPWSAPAPSVSAPDLSSPACVRHTYQALPLTLIEPLDSAGPSLFSTLRVRVTASLRSCDLWAGVDSARVVGDATDHITIDAHGWIANSDCGGQTPPPWALAFPSPQNQYIHVTDQNGAARLDLTTASTLADSCEPAGPGNACTMDCQCTALPGAGCVLNEEAGGCAATCNHDLDCADPLRPFCAAPGNLRLSVCASGDTSCSDCAFPLGCTAGRCVPPPLVISPPRCDCQSDCPIGHLCEEETRICVIPCADDPMCPAGSACILGGCRLLEN